MTKKQIEMFAKLYLATHANYFDYFNVDDIDVSDEDKELLIDAVHNLGKIISEKNPNNFTENKKIVEYVCKHF